MATEQRLEKIKAVARRRQQGVVVLQDVHDPHNAAAVLRTCDAFGIQKVCFIFELEKKYNPKKVGKATSSSANKWLDFSVYTSTEKCLKDLRRQGYRIYATILDNQAKSIFKTKFTPHKKIALMFGNEHRGLSEKAMNLAHHKLYIPMAGFVQSLNLSVTAAICLFELTRQRQGKRFFMTSQSSLNILVKKWLKM